MDIPLILFTRFSIRYKKFISLAAIENESKRELWFKQRVEFFKLITYPSIKAQIYRPYKWYLLFSVGDEKYVSSMMQWIDKWIIPVYIENIESINGVIDSIIKSIIGEHSEVLLSRIDSDDALCAEYYYNIFRAINKKDIKNESVLMYRYGYRWDGKNIQKINFANNPFVTIYNNIWSCGSLNPLKINHSKILDYKHYILCESVKPTWLQVLHGSNLLNGFRVNSEYINRIDPQIVLDNYNISENILDFMLTKSSDDGS